ncbi:hypothetical protein [Jeotgalibaca sp. A127]|uniref:hypothetical protein n=1 Tax=Jeotgalibaca sp. A127 TaxID=3457324 RepID=UPI003FD25B4F
MYHGKRLLIRNQAKLKPALDTCNKASAEVWNLCLRKSKAHHLATGKWIGKTQRQKTTATEVAGIRIRRHSCRNHQGSGAMPRHPLLFVRYLRRWDRKSALGATAGGFC